MPNILAVPHRRQETNAGCLPACAQMILNYLGLDLSQTELARLMGTHPQAGTPYSRITRLRSNKINIAYQRASGLDDLAKWLERQLPVIAFVQMRELPHWQGHWSQHAVVVLGFDQIAVHVLDPAASAQVIAVPVNDFVLAWEEMDWAYAVIAKA
jgi:ABC-type bacteriocin/lantibiotic exporter with double-glycine peptidase domain